MMEERKVVVPSDFVFKGKHKLFMASEYDTSLWFRFHQRVMGFRFFDNATGQPINSEAIFCRHRHDSDLLNIAAGNRSELYRRIDARGWTNGVYQEAYVPDLLTGMAVREEQGYLFHDNDIL